MLNRRMPNGMYGGVRGERKSPLLDCRFLSECAAGLFLVFIAAPRLSNLDFYIFKNSDWRKIR